MAVKVKCLGIKLLEHNHSIIFFVGGGFRGGGGGGNVSSISDTTMFPMIAMIKS